MKRLWLIIIGFIALVLQGCSGMNVEDFKGQNPKLVLEEYFLGETYAYGLFQDRFGNVKRQFKVDIQGSFEDGVLTLVEDFHYQDGEEDQRIWKITPEADGRYTGTAADIIGEAEGRIRGNALNWKYTMNLPVGDSHYKVNFDDWMFLQNDGVMINKATVTKWGFRVGEVILFFSKTPQDQ
jgi:hypothetical protein